MLAASDASMACCCRSAAASSAALARARRSISVSDTVARAGEMPQLPLMYSATSTCVRGGCRGRSLHCMVHRNLHCMCLLSRPRLHTTTRQWEDAKHLLVEAQPPCAPLCWRRWWRRIWRCCAGTPSPAPGRTLAQLLLAPIPWVQAHVPRRIPPPGRLGRPHGVRARWAERGLPAKGGASSGRRGVLPTLCLPSHARQTAPRLVASARS